MTKGHEWKDIAACAADGEIFPEISDRCLSEAISSS
jgi:hypothetical protein